MNAKKYVHEIAKDEIEKPIIYPASISIDLFKHIILEIGPGRGDILFHLAENNKDALVIGIEIRRKRVDKIIKHIERLGMKNIMIINADAKIAMPKIFKSSSVDEIHINFPDPWPKNKHAGHRLISSTFAVECARILKDDGILYFASDHDEYAKMAKKALLSSKKFVEDNASPRPFPTFYEAKWKKMGRNISDMKFRITSSKIEK